MSSLLYWLFKILVWQFIIEIEYFAFCYNSYNVQFLVIVLADYPIVVVVPGIFGSFWWTNKKILHQQTNAGEFYRHFTIGSLNHWTLGSASSLLSLNISSEYKICNTANRNPVPGTQSPVPSRACWPYTASCWPYTASVRPDVIADYWFRFNPTYMPTITRINSPSNLSTLLYEVGSRTDVEMSIYCPLTKYILWNSENLPLWFRKVGRLGWGMGLHEFRPQVLSQISPWHLVLWR